MTPTTYLNSPVRSCKTCVHFCPNGKMYNPETHEPAIDAAGCFHFMMKIHEALEECQLAYWQVKPPRKSLRQWLYDLIWR